MKSKDLLPFKVVAEELGVSRTTLWRARQSLIVGFPEPTVRSRMVFWRRADLGKLEDALFRYQGRIVFERQRNAVRKISALKRAVAAQGPRLRRVCRRPPAHPDLFETASGEVSTLHI